VAETGITPRLIEGRGGIFDVAIDGRVVFSKRSVGRFPTPDEIVGAMRAAGAGSA
jgi:selT/selW/selH-like putative selenoprotein